MNKFYALAASLMIAIVGMLCNNQEAIKAKQVPEGLIHPDPRWIREMPMTVVLSSISENPKACWHVSVNSLGQGGLNLLWQEKSKSEEFPVSVAQFNELREALISEKFFELETEQGEMSHHGSVQVVSIALHSSKTVRIYHGLPGSPTENEYLQIRSSIRIARLVRTWIAEIIEEKGLLDFSQNEDRFIRDCKPE